MLNYRTLEYKPQQNRKDSNNKNFYFQDLLAKTWRTWTGSEHINPVVINEYYVARPDLISLACYGDDAYGDMICKFNGISNPFELNEGMIISIPPLDWAISGTEKRENASCDLISSDDSIQKTDKTKKQRSDARSSSTPTVGDASPYVIDKTLGMVFY